jgi:hypothetical protein
LGKKISLCGGRHEISEFIIAIDFQDVNPRPLEVSPKPVYVSIRSDPVHHKWPLLNPIRFQTFDQTPGNNNLCKVLGDIEPFCAICPVG